MLTTQEDTMSIKTANQIITAVLRNDLEVRFQPIVNWDFDRKRFMVKKFEALARLHVDQEELSPGEFIPQIEGTAYMAVLDRQVTAAAIKQVARWRRLGYDVGLSVNASTEVLESADYVVFLRDALRKEGLSPEALMVEVSETCTIWKNPTFIGVLRELQQVGMTVAFDDFPCMSNHRLFMGWVARERLGQVLKLDRSLVQQALTPGRAERLEELAGYILFAERNGLTVVAEGIEEAEQASLLIRLGITAFQGYHFGRPMKRDEAVHRLYGETQSQSPKLAPEDALWWAEYGRMAA
jgi:EAL domain-containing protein (putative c-di-GMP-specific phosphodiesterase class I)